MADVCQGKHRLAAVSFTSGYRGNRPGGGNRCLGCVADTIALDAIDDRLPIQRRASKISLVRSNRPRWLPNQVVRVVNAALDRRERPALPGQFNAGLHGSVTHKFHHLGAELLAFRRAIADAGVVHQVAQAHNPQADAARLVGSNGELRDSRNVGIGFDNIVQEDG